MLQATVCVMIHEGMSCQRPVLGSVGVLFKIIVTEDLKMILAEQEDNQAIAPKKKIQE